MGREDLSRQVNTRVSCTNEGMGRAGQMVVVRGMQRLGGRPDRARALTVIHSFLVTVLVRRRNALRATLPLSPPALRCSIFLLRNNRSGFLSYPGDHRPTRLVRDRLRLDETTTGLERPAGLLLVIPKRLRIMKQDRSSSRENTSAFIVCIL